MVSQNNFQLVITELLINQYCWHRWLLTKLGSAWHQVLSARRLTNLQRCVTIILHLLKLFLPFLESCQSKLCLFTLPPQKKMFTFGRLGNLRGISFSFLPAKYRFILLPSTCKFRNSSIVLKSAMNRSSKELKVHYNSLLGHDKVLQVWKRDIKNSCQVMKGIDKIKEKLSSLEYLPGMPRVKDAVNHIAKMVKGGPSKNSVVFDEQKEQNGNLYTICHWIFHGFHNQRQFYRVSVIP